MLRFRTGDLDDFLERARLRPGDLDHLVNGSEPEADGDADEGESP